MKSTFPGISFKIIALPIQNNNIIVLIGLFLALCTSCTKDPMIYEIDNIKSYIFSLDCKLYSNSSDYNEYLDQFARAVHKVAVKLNMQHNFIVEAQDIGFLEKIKQLDNSYKLFINVSSMALGIEICEKHEFYGIVISNDNATIENVKLAHEKGFRVMLFDMYSKNDNIEAISKSPDYVQTDKPIHFLKVFDKYKK